MRGARFSPDGPSYYHCVSRILERRMLLTDEEKNCFLETMRAAADFAGLEILTYTILADHIHLLLHVPEVREISETEALKRIKGLYGKARATDVAMSLQGFRDQDHHDEATALLHSYTRRMGDLAEYMKILMQRFTQSYNRRHHRRGTLWEDRFKSVLVEGTPDAISLMAAYIELNAVRAGIVQDPAAYRFCGYGAASAGDPLARRGLKHICRILGNTGNWTTCSRVIRAMMFTPGNPSTPRQQTALRKEIETILEEGGKLSKAHLLHCRVRYLSDGVVLGSKAFVEHTFRQHRDQFGVKRKTGARRPRYCDWGDLCTMRDLRLNPISLPAAR